VSETTEAIRNAVDVYGRKRYRNRDADIDGTMTIVPVDDSGRIMVVELSDREIAEELLATLRQIADVISQIGANPGSMMARFMPGMSGVMDAINKGK
jgi:hypothetical protein